MYGTTGCSNPVWCTLSFLGCRTTPERESALVRAVAHAATMPRLMCLCRCSPHRNQPVLMHAAHPTLLWCGRPLISRGRRHSSVGAQPTKRREPRRSPLSKGLQQRTDRKEPLSLPSQPRPITAAVHPAFHNSRRCQDSKGSLHRKDSTQKRRSLGRRHRMTVPIAQREPTCSPRPCV